MGGQQNRGHSTRATAYGGDRTGVKDGNKEEEQREKPTDDQRGDREHDRERDALPGGDGARGQPRISVRSVSDAM